MDPDGEIDLERVLFFEHARKIAEAAYAQNPLDADNLTRWGGALIELSPCQTSTGEAKQMLSDAVLKLQEALVVNPKKHDTLWCLGNAYTSHAFMTPDIEEAKPYFQKATVSFLQAVEEDPTNDLYQKSFEVSSKAPGLHAELRKGNMGGAAFSNSTSAPSKKKQPTGISDFGYDVMGWICLGVGILTWVSLAKHNMPPQPTI